MLAFWKSIFYIISMEKNYKLPDRLKSRRKELGLTLLQVAKRVGISEATVQRWENGAIKSLRYENVVKLADALDTTPAYLMGWEEQPVTVYQYDAEENKIKKTRTELHQLIDEAPDRQLYTLELILRLPTASRNALATLITQSKDDEPI